jgi:hypothetical protein
MEWNADSAALATIVGFQCVTQGQGCVLEYVRQILFECEEAYVYKRMYDWGFLLTNLFILTNAWCLELNM